MIFGASGPTFSQGAKREFGAENLSKSLCQQQHVAFLASALHPKPQKRKHRNKRTESGQHAKRLITLVVSHSEEEGVTIGLHLASLQLYAQ